MTNGTEGLLLQLFTIFVWAKVFGELFERLYLPAVLGEILAGIVLGPYATQFVIPTPTVYSIAEIGAVFLLFTVGLETNPKDLISVSRLSLRVAVGGVALPFIAGFWFLRADGQPVHEAAFVAAAMVATSVGITARVLRDLNVLKLRVSRIVLGAAVFDDMLGMILLGIVVSVATGVGIRWLHLGLVIAEAVGFAVFMIFFGPRLVRRIRPGLQRMQTHDAPLVLALAICLGLSVVATKIGMAAIIGAFFAGLAFADYLAGVEPGTARAGHQPTALAILLLHHGISPATLGLLARGGRDGAVHFAAGDHHQDAGLRLAAHPRGLDDRAARGSRHDAAGRGGAHRRAHRLADEHDLAAKLRLGDYDDGDHHHPPAAGASHPVP